MNSKEAKSFEVKDDKNARIVKAHFDCDCQPYEDIFTYRRWEAQGLVVSKGQKGVKVSRYTVFCRCQVQEPDTEPKAQPKAEKANTGHDLPSVDARLAYYTGNTPKA